MVPGKLNLAEVTFMSEDQARKYIEAVVWPNGPVCPHCGGTKAWDIKEGTARAGVYECSECGKQFTVTVGTIMESSHISLRRWLVDQKTI